MEIKEIIDVFSTNLDRNLDALKIFETFVKKVDSKDIKTLFLISNEYLEAVLATFQDTEIASKITDYDDKGNQLLCLVKEVRETLTPIQLKNMDILVLNRDTKYFCDFIAEVYEAAKEYVVYLREKYSHNSNAHELFKKIFENLKKDQFISSDYFEKLNEFGKTCPDMILSDYIYNLVDRSIILLKEAKEKQGPTYSTSELSSMKKQKYIDTYNLKLSSDVTLEEIEEVIKVSSSIGEIFLQNHPEVFKDKKDIYLENIKILKEVVPDLRIVVERDPDALLSTDLKKNLELIKLYQIDLSELLYYQEKALTDLSYFRTLDLMIECYGSINLKKLLDKNNTDLKNKIVLRLLGLSNLDLKGLFPLTNSEIDTFLEQKSTVLKNGMNSFDECILDVYSNGGYFYNINGIIISRPKVLRNINGKDEISVEDVCCNSFFNKEEIETIRKAIDELKKDYQLKKQKI